MKQKIWNAVYSQVDFKNCTISIKGSSLTISVSSGEGNFRWTEARNIQYMLNRGSLTGATIREGDQVPVELSFEFQWEYITQGGSASVASPVEALQGTGSWTGQSKGDSCDPYAVDIEFANVEPCAAGHTETTTFADFRWERLDYDPRTGLISCSGKCHITKPTTVLTS